MEFIFFAFLAAVILAPQVLRHRERGRLHDTLRLAFERGQPVPPELMAAMFSDGRRRYVPPPGEAAEYGPRDPLAGVGPTDWSQRDLRRGVVWLAIGLGLVAVGAIAYAGFYSDGGAPEAAASFAAIGAVPAFVGLAYLGLWWFGGRKTRV